MGDCGVQEDRMNWKIASGDDRVRRNVEVEIISKAEQSGQEWGRIRSVIMNTL
jgi:hypothetical protein